MSRIEEDLFLPPLENPMSSPDVNGTEPVKSPTPSKSSSKVGWSCGSTLLTRTV